MKHCLSILVLVLALLVGAVYYTNDPFIDALGKPMIIKNADVRTYLAKHALKGPLSKHPEFKDFPLKGVYMFTNLGSVGWADFSHLQNWDSSAGTFDWAMTSLVVQSGLARAYAALMAIPTIAMALMPGGFTLRLFRALNYSNRFEWPSGGMRDGERAKVTASMAGGSYEFDFEGKMGFTQWFIQRDGGRMYERDTTWLGDYMQFHDYKLLRLVDESGTIDEEHFRMFMKKIGGQDLYYLDPLLFPKNN
ncbi:unnamed protein product [Polarella glacialis]|uniref:Uncharacterized protein n=1 Tax=Polarella glacialis TaxID=89957 RepID=A0A813FHZ1_POLGL|nr:unnamed protein product [Polarella glacialis]